MSKYLAWWRCRGALPASNTNSAVAGSKQQDSWSQCPGDEDSVSPDGGGDLCIEDGGHANSSAAVLYLKDWHFRSDHPEYQVPSKAPHISVRETTLHTQPEIQLPFLPSISK